MEALGRFVPCPECTGPLRVVKNIGDTGSSLYDKLRIPPEYMKATNLSTDEGTEYRNIGKELFSLSDLSAFSHKSIESVGRLLDKLNADIFSGSVTKLSCYVHMPLAVDSKLYIYGAQIEALTRGLSVTPLLNANTLYGIQKSADFSGNFLQTCMERQNRGEALEGVSPDSLAALDGWRFMTFTGLTYFDLQHSDLVFIETTANTIEKAYSALASLLADRARWGLPTFVFGYWSPSTAGNKLGGLRYLLAPEGSRVRLDMLVPYEIVRKSNEGGNGVVVDGILTMDSVKSSVSAGLSVDRLMASD